MENIILKFYLNLKYVINNVISYFQGMNFYFFNNNTQYFTVNSQKFETMINGQMQNEPTDSYFGQHSCHNAVTCASLQDHNSLRCDAANSPQWLSPCLQ